MEKHVASIFKVEKYAKRRNECKHIVNPLLDYLLTWQRILVSALVFSVPADEGDIFPRNVGRFSTNYTALSLRRYNISNEKNIINIMKG